MNEALTAGRTPYYTPEQKEEPGRGQASRDSGQLTAAAVGPRELREVAQSLRAEQRLDEGPEGLTLREGFLEEAAVSKSDPEFTRQRQPLNRWKKRWDSS